MPIIWRRPDPDDEIFSADFVVTSPLPKNGKDEEPDPNTPQQPDEFPHLTWTEGEASRDDPMFGKLHVAFMPLPDR